METNNICDLCGTEKVMKPAGVSKAGKPYKAFLACPNWKSHQTTPGSQTPLLPDNKSNGEALALVLEEIQAVERRINERLDAMAEYLVKRDKPKVDLKSL